MKNGFALAAGAWLAVAGLAMGQNWGPRTTGDAVGPKAPCCSADEGASYWGGVDYLLWFVTKSPLPVPLVTRGGTGIPGDPDVSVIYGGSSVDYGVFSGARLNLGGWIDPDKVWGVDGAGFFLFSEQRGFSAQSDASGQPPLGQPVITPGFGPSSYSTSLPGALYGTIWSDLTFRFYGWDVNVVRNIVRDNGLQVDALVGYRNLRLSETLVLTSRLRTIVDGGVDFLGTPVAANSALITSDSFGASTDVYAPQIGGHVSYTSGRCSFDFTTKVALGWATEEVAIHGSTTLMPPFGGDQPTTTAPGGILATSTNIPGGKTTGRFVVVPEVTGRVGYDVTDGLRLSVGYSFLYISEVVRPGSQIDRVVNPNNVPSDRDFGRFAGPARPALDVQRSSFWAHGVNFGAEVRY